MHLRINKKKHISKFLSSYKNKIKKLQQKQQQKTDKLYDKSFFYLSIIHSDYYFDLIWYDKFRNMKLEKTKKNRIKTSSKLDINLLINRSFLMFS